MALVMVAQDKGFFTEQGLDVELKEFSAGKFALQAFLAGSLDYSISGDVPPALAALQGNKFLVPAQIVSQTKGEVRVVARKDGELNEAEAYFKTKKRKLATSIGGGPEFFTYELLNKLAVTKDQIEIVSQKPEDMVATLVSGSVDAIAIFDPVASIAEKKLGDQGITFTDESIYSELYVLEAPLRDREDQTRLTKILLSLIEAEQFVKDHPNEAKEIVVKYTKLDRETVDSTWEHATFHMSLTPKLLEFWTRQAAWARATGKISPDAPAPDFTHIIFPDVLRQIAPSAVEIPSS